MDCAVHVAAPRRLELESKPLVLVDLKRATELRRAGHTIREIARMMQLSEATLMRRLRVAKVPRGPRIKRVPTMEALALYRSGVSVAELAKRFAVSPSWIRHELHKAGVRFTLGRPKGTFDGRPHEFAVDIDRIAARHREGKTIQEIADEMGLSRSVVHRRLRQRGLSRAVGPRSRVRPDDVGRMYWGEGLEAHEVAKALAVPPSTVTRKLKVAGLPRRGVGAAANPPIYISPGLKALIAGLLLGDGYLCPNSKASPVSCALVLGQRVDRLEWLEQVRSAFAAEGVDCLPIRRTSVMDHRSGRRQHAVTLSTRFYRELLAERRRWYPEGTKVVPTDLRLTPTTLALVLG